MLFSVREGSQERPKGHRRSSSYGSTGDTAAMMAQPIPPMGSLRHGQSYSEIPHAYDYQVNILTCTIRAPVLQNLEFWVTFPGVYFIKVKRHFLAFKMLLLMFMISTPGVGCCF